LIYLTLHIINAGCRSVEHASFIDSAGIAACLLHGTWIVPTLSVGEFYSGQQETTGQSGGQDRLV
jgi:hypothetical protein